MSQPSSSTGLLKDKLEQPSFFPLKAFSDYSSPCADKDTASKYFAPVTPKKTRTKISRKHITFNNPCADRHNGPDNSAPATPVKRRSKGNYNSDLPGSVRSKGKSIHQEDDIGATRENVNAYESDPQVKRTANDGPSMKYCNPIGDTNLTKPRKRRVKKHRPKVMFIDKPRTRKTAASRESQNTDEKYVKKKVLRENTPIDATKEPHGPKISKLAKSSCRRALNFDTEEKSEDLGINLGSEAIALVGQGNGVPEQACRSKNIEYFPFVYHRKRKAPSNDQSGAETITMTKKAEFPIVYRRKRRAICSKQSLQTMLVTKDPNVGMETTSGDFREIVPNQMPGEQVQHLNIDSKEGIIVPYEGSSDPVKKLYQRAKVHLDQETNRVWKLLLADVNSPGIDGMDEENKKWWDEERIRYKGLADLFVSRMRLVQGDRQFSPWKGSVIDSVVGTFLTQNVSDLLSCSAFMSIASNFPPKSNIDKGLCSKMWTTNACHESQRGPSYVGETRNVIEIDKGSCSEMWTTNAPHGSQRYPSNQGETRNVIEIDRVSSSCKNKNPSNLNSDGTSKLESKENSTMKHEIDWDSLRREVQPNGWKKERLESTIDSVDWEAVRLADVDEISKIIKDRGMNEKLAKRIQDCLDRVARDHETLDLEWLRDIAPDKAKEYLLSIFGMGLKSVECIRLLTLHQCAFPVDTNVARVAVRLGWVPLQPLPDSTQLHLLQLYPDLKTVQRYLWPRLCKLDHRTLYELHYQMITFGKVFCTKKKPNCSACPMRGECRHYASTVASSRLTLRGPDDKCTGSAPENGAALQNPGANISSMSLTPPLLEQSKEQQHDKVCGHSNNNSPIVEHPVTPEPEHTEASGDIEDTLREVPDDIEIIELTSEEMKQNLDWEMTKALVISTQEAASTPMPVLKKINRLRTQHEVYELPDSHSLLAGFDEREPDDPSNYLLAIWTPGETADSIRPWENSCVTQVHNKLCDDNTCYSCNSIREADSQSVRGTLLIPCRTAMRGSFPLNGTFFQVNEVFADYESSVNPINVPRELIWSLPRRTVYFGTSISSIFRGFTAEEIQRCFWRGHVCVRAIDRQTRAPRPLVNRLHLSASKYQKMNSKTDKETSSSTPVKSKKKIQKTDKEKKAKQKSNVKNKIQGHGKRDIT